MNIFAIQDKMILQWNGTQDNQYIKYAIGNFMGCGCRETVNQDWRWLFDDLVELYSKDTQETSACVSWLNGWIDGASYVLNKSLLCVLKKGWNEED